MIKVIIPVIALLVIILCKKIPKIGGNVNVGLFTAGALSLLLGGVFNPVDWFGAWINGVDQLAWVICLSIFGSIYASTQVKLGTIDTIMGYLKARFEKSPRVLIVCIIIVLVLAGSLLGDAIAASTVIGVLTIGVLASMGISGEKITCLIVMGASMGSLMPPISQAFALSSALTNTEPDLVLRYGYVTVPIIVVLMCIYANIIFINKKTKIPHQNINGKPFEIIKENWSSLIPLILLIVIVVFRTTTIGGVHFDLVPEVLGKVMISENLDLYTALSQISILRGVSNGIVLSIIFVTIISCLFPKVRGEAKECVVEGMKNVKATVLIQVCAGFMLGCFYAGGQIEAVQAFAQGLNEHLLKIGGAGSMALIGMLTGSQSTAQNVIFSFFGPALISIGMDPVQVAAAGAHLAAGGMGLPPADLTTFCVAGIVGSMIGKEVDPIKSMIMMIPMCLLMITVGMILLYI